VTRELALRLEFTRRVIEEIVRRLRRA